MTAPALPSAVPFRYVGGHTYLADFVQYYGNVSDTVIHDGKTSFAQPGSGDDWATELSFDLFMPDPYTPQQGDPSFLVAGAFYGRYSFIINQGAGSGLRREFKLRRSAFGDGGSEDIAGWVPIGDNTNEVGITFTNQASGARGPASFGIRLRPALNGVTYTKLPPHDPYPYTIFGYTGTFGGNPHGTSATCVRSVAALDDILSGRITNGYVALSGTDPTLQGNPAYLEMEAEVKGDGEYRVDLGVEYTNFTLRQPVVHISVNSGPEALYVLNGTPLPGVATTSGLQLYDGDLVNLRVVIGNPEIEPSGGDPYNKFRKCSLTPIPPTQPFPHRKLLSATKAPPFADGSGAGVKPRSIRVHHEFYR